MGHFLKLLAVLLGNAMQSASSNVNHFNGKYYIILYRVILLATSPLH